MSRTRLGFLSFTTLSGLMLTTVGLISGQHLLMAEPPNAKSSDALDTSSDSRDFLLRDVDLVLKNGQHLKLMAGSAIQVIDKNAEEVRLQRLGEVLSVPAEQVAPPNIAESQLRIRALILSPENMRPWGRFLLEENRYREAANIWKNVATLSQNKPQDLYLWAMSCVQSQQWEAALHPLAQLLDLERTDTDGSFPLTGISWTHVRNLRGMSHLRNGSPKRALPDLLAVADEQPEMVSNRLLLFETFLSLNRYSEAMEQEDQIATLSNNDPQVMRQLDQQVWALCDVVVHKLNKSRRAILEDLQFPQLLTDRQPNTVAQAELGIRALGALRQYEASNEFLWKARKLFPKSIELLFLAGVSAAISGDFLTASGAFDQVIERSPKHVGAYKNRASIHFQNREFLKSSEDYLMLASLNPDNMDAWYSLALCQLKFGEIGEAITLLEMITETHPNYFRPWNLLAWTYATYPEESFRNGQAAVLCALRANELTGFSDAAFLDTLAAAYAEAGHFDDAISTQINAIDKLPTTPDRSEFLSRLEMYRQNEPFREDPRHGDYR